MEPSRRTLPRITYCSIFLRYMEERIRLLSPQLFWDVDRETVDAKKNARWLIERVVQRGTWEDWLIISELYGKNGLRAIAPELRLDEKSANFIRMYCRP